ncbi:MAG: LamG domain-containing protein, partial [Chloroflexi bacterium]|nr:LamG domain-containing protein [Chloroflexota bacterium]
MTYYFRVRSMDAVGNWEDWPSGDGDASIKIDPWAVPPPAFWDSGYTHRRNLLVLNQDSDTVPAGFPLRIYFDGSTSPTAAEIYAASQSSTPGDDLRVVYDNATELNRVVEYFSPNRIEIIFPSQEAIGGGGSSSGVYQLYYGNANSFGAPSDVNEVFLPKVDGNTIGLWHFQDGYGNFIGDASDAGYNGSFTSPGWEDGFLGMAGVFNGSDSVVSIGRHYASDNIGPITIEGWFKQTKAGWGKVVMKGRDGGGQYFLGINGDRNPELVVGTTVGSEDTKGGPNLEVGRWYHIAVTHNGSNEMNVYVNGNRVGGNNNTHPLVSSSDSLYLGNAPWWGGQAFGGSMQHVRISNIARTDFPYARIDVLPQVSAGAQQEPTPNGASDLAVTSLAAYQNVEGGTLVEAVVENRGSLSTRNAFYTDIYVDGLPQTDGDVSGSVQFWVNDAIGAGDTVTLTAVLPDSAIGARRSLRPGEAPQESTVTLYTMVDSMSSTGDGDRSNNANADGTQLCVASADAYDGDDGIGSAQVLAEGASVIRNFSTQDDLDWMAIDVVAGR